MLVHKSPQDWIILLLTPLLTLLNYNHYSSTNISYSPYLYQNIANSHWSMTMTIEMGIPWREIPWRSVKRNVRKPHHHRMGQLWKLIWWINWSSRGVMLWFSLPYSFSHTTDTCFTYLCLPSPWYLFYLAQYLCCLSLLLDTCFIHAQHFPLELVLTIYAAMLSYLYKLLE